MGIEINVLSLMWLVFWLVLIEFKKRKSNIIAFAATFVYFAYLLGLPAVSNETAVEIFFLFLYAVLFFEMQKADKSKGD